MLKSIEWKKRKIEINVYKLNPEKNVGINRQNTKGYDIIMSFEWVFTQFLYFFFIIEKKIEKLLTIFE